MMCATECPSDRQLKALSLGRLAFDESEELLAHVGACSTCQSELETVNDAEDSLIAALRNPGELDRFQAESDCQIAMTKALGAMSLAQSQRPMEQSIGLTEQIGEYRILRPLGRGGMGSVYLAKHTRLGREVALKVLAHHRLGDARAAERFEAEMQTIGRLSHPNIVTAHDARDIDGTAVLVTEYIDGYDLEELLRRTGPLSVHDACEIVRQTAVALQYTHEQGFVHRDVKPSNIMISRDGLVKVLDLGLARLQHGDQHPDRTATGQAMGTVDFMAPEQVTDSRRVSIQADIYSLGCTLFKLLTGAAPFEQEKFLTAYDKMTAHVSAPAPSLADRMPSLPKDLVALVASMLAKEVTDRPQTPAELVKRLKVPSKGNDVAFLVKIAEQASPLSAKQQRMSAEVMPQLAQPPLKNRQIPLRALLATVIGGLLLWLAYGVIVKITYPDGTTISHQVPTGGSVKIQPDDEAQQTPLTPKQKQWVRKILRLRDHMQTAFAFGPELTLLPPDEGYEIVRAAWPKIWRNDVKTGILKAFAFGKALHPKKHARLLEVLKLGTSDSDAEVRDYATTYMQEHFPDYQPIDRKAWVKKITGLKDHMHTAFGVGPELTLLTPDDGLAIVEMAWPKIKHQEVKTGILKAFSFGKALAPKKHPYLKQVLELGTSDADKEIREYANTYMKEHFPNAGNDESPVESAAAAPMDRDAWIKKLVGLRDHMHTAFGVGPELTLLPPEQGLAIVKAAWPKIEHLPVKTGILKAFSFGKALKPKKHARLKEILELGLGDADPKVQNYAQVYFDEHFGNSK